MLLLLLLLTECPHRLESQVNVGRGRRVCRVRHLSLRLTVFVLDWLLLHVLHVLRPRLLLLWYTIWLRRVPWHHCVVDTRYREICPGCTRLTH